MPRNAQGLSAAKVKSAGPGRYGDGNGLYLAVQPNGTRSWVFRWVRRNADGKPRMREMGLGTASGGAAAVSLAEAREKAGLLIKAVRDGIDPLADRDSKLAAEAAARQAAIIQALTFRTAGERYIEAHEAGWSSRTRTGWVGTLRDYAYSAFGDLPVSVIDTGHVTAALEPIWRVKPETAGRVRFRVEAVLDYARVRGWREGENPARWRGHLDQLLPAQSKVAPVEHHAALPYREIYSFVVDLRKQAGTAARALEFAILTAARTGEALGATWAEIDLNEKVWTIPAERMKGGKEHRVPLAEPALAILREMAKLKAEERDGLPVFPGARLGKPLSNMALLMTLRRMKRGDLTAHGFRSTFRDWAAERTTFPPEVAEMALAHVVENKVEAAYRRGDLFQKRRQLADAWAKFCHTPVVATGKVLAIRGADHA